MVVRLKKSLVVGKVKPNQISKIMIGIKFAACTLVILFACSCKNHQEQSKIEKPKIENAKVSKSVIAPSKTTAIQNEEIKEVALKNEFEILLPRAYRDWENSNPVDALTKEWLERNKVDGKYYLSKAKYSIERGFDNCSGDSTKIIKSNSHTILLINKTSFELGEIESIKIEKSKIWPNEKLKFHFGNEAYTLRAEGDIIGAENANSISTESADSITIANGGEVFHEVENYKLYISSDNSTETLFLEQKSFEDTFVELIFIGDLDRDGKPDLIFRANRNYEEDRVLVYFSSKAKDAYQIRKVSEIAVQFDC